jgi:rhodanese-related sulfurtransferase
MTHPRISAHEAHAWMLEQGYVYLDVRSPEEFSLGHPHGAYNVPFALRAPQGLASNPAFVRVVRALFGPEQKVILGCQSGKRSLAAASALLAAGYLYVAEQRAGFEGRRDAFGRTLEPGWRAAGLPWASEPIPGRDYGSIEPRS